MSYGATKIRANITGRAVNSRQGVEGGCCCALYPRCKLLLSRALDVLTAGQRNEKVGTAGLERVLCFLYRDFMMAREKKKILVDMPDNISRWKENYESDGIL